MSHPEGARRRAVLYSRKHCHLCDEAHEMVERVRARVDFDLVVLDLDDEAPAEKLAAYTYEVPVLEIDGKKAMKLRFDEARLERLVAS